MLDYATDYQQKDLTQHCTQQSLLDTTVDTTGDTTVDLIYDTVQVYRSAIKEQSKFKGNTSV